ncbi:hypothetical protein DL766_003570 [Monosporascus sp. MC13-8B]|nr:hypothetical protein DL763_006805 [Monosporascus cannonballus]RYP33265.1 hypothetical protein DL766_003570 [Monosporascus sp. MC13-8B]
MDPPLDPLVACLLTRKKGSNLSRERSISATSYTTPSDQKPRVEKNRPYRDPHYETMLATIGSFMVNSALDIADTSKTWCRTLLETKQSAPEDSLFRDDIFNLACEMVEGRNEAKIVQDITRLIVPSAETLVIFGAKHLNILTESVNEGWNNSVPLTGTRPQPDYSVGFRREAFTNDQLITLSPFLALHSGDQSLFMATYYMYFPFLTCEVKCNNMLAIAERQNAHSMTIAVRAIVELFRAVKREGELHRQILAFSIAHDDSTVRIYGHYPVINGQVTQYYRHRIAKFAFAAPGEKEKWTAYQFTKNVYDIWMPAHFKNICSAIDQLPSHFDFSVQPLSGPL